MGYLKLIIGCMFSGKTSKLIAIYKKNVIAGVKTSVINYIDDKRYDNEKLSTHDGVKIDCFRGKTLEEVIQNEKKSIDESKVIIINEGQFFQDLYNVVKELIDKDKVVYVGGLDGDYKMEKFGSILDLIPICDDIEKLHAICSYCKKQASFTKRTISLKNSQILIRGADKYLPVCRNCHNY